MRERYVGNLLANRRAQEAKRARKREEREARWREIAAGEREGLTVAQASALWSDRAGEGEVGNWKGGRRGADPYDRLAAAVRQASGAKRGRPPAALVLVGDDGEELLSVAEAARRSGLADEALRARIRRGSLKAVKRDGTRIPASALEAA